MNETVIGVTVLVAVALGSGLLYGRDHRTRRYAEGRPGRIESPGSFRWVYKWIQLSTVGFGLAALLFVHPLLLQFEVPTAGFVAGVATALGGFALFWHGKHELGRQYSPCYDAWLPTQLVQSGVYAWVRHPIYTANVLLLLGLALMAGTAWLAANAVLLGVYYARSAPREERALAAGWPEYAEYVQRTGRFWPRLRAGQRRACQRASAAASPARS